MAGKERNEKSLQCSGDKNGMIGYNEACHGGNP
jgi:hypothetical protein